MSLLLFLSDLFLFLMKFFFVSIFFILLLLLSELVLFLLFLLQLSFLCLPLLTIFLMNFLLVLLLLLQLPLQVVNPVHIFFFLSLELLDPFAHSLFQGVDPPNHLLF